jgi:hypothetical protein
MAGSGRASLMLKIVGWSSIVLSAMGLWYHATYMTADYSQAGMPPYFYQAWRIMAGVNIGLLLVGILVGVQLVRGRVRWVRALVILQVVVVIDCIAPGLLWLNPRFGRGVAAASGISGGTMIGVIALFPIWGSWAGLWAARRISRQSLDSAGA